MKYILLILSMFFLSSCVLIEPTPKVEPLPEPVLIKVTPSDGIDFELWVDVDHRRYIKYKDKKMYID